jgi:hypothetical protein
MIRAISLWQPYATLMALGLKTIETRGRRTHVRGALAIHAARECYPYAGLPEDLKALLRQQGLESQALQRGCVLAVVSLVDCQPTEELPISNPERCCGNYAPGRFGWLTRDVRRLAEPVHCRAKQGFFFLPDAVEAAVRAQFKDGLEDFGAVMETKQQ